MDPETFLAQPIKVISPHGYQSCLDCGRYFHHQTIYCPTCGKKVVRLTEISIIDFIRKTAKAGAGPLNTLYTYLERLEEQEGIKHKGNLLPLTNQTYIAIYDFANKIYEESGGFVGGIYHPDGTFTPFEY